MAPSNLARGSEEGLWKEKGRADGRPKAWEKGALPPGNVVFCTFELYSKMLSRPIIYALFSQFFRLQTP